MTEPAEQGAAGSAGASGDDVAAVAERLRAWFGERFERLEGFAAELAAQLGLDPAGRLELPELKRRRLKTVAERFLAENPPVDGCGVVFAHAAFGTESGDLEWWVREDEARFARFSFGVVPGAERYYDYEQHEWFTRAWVDGEASLVGPYIDFLGVEAYVLTLTVPAQVDGKRVGAVGNDLQMPDLEAALLPILLESERELVLLGNDGHVLFGNSARFLPGERVPDAMPGYARERLFPATASVWLLSATPEG